MPKQTGKLLLCLMAVVLITAILPVSAFAAEDAPEAQVEELTRLRGELAAIMGPGEQTDAVTAKIDRLIALGDPDGALKDYLEKMIKLQQLQHEMEQLKSGLAALESANAGIKEISDSAGAILSGEDKLTRIEMEISAQGARLLKGAGFEDTADNQLLPLVEQTLSCLDSTNNPDLASVILFSGLNNSGLLNETGSITSLDAIRNHMGALLAGHTAGDEELRTLLEEKSAAIAAKANGAEPLSPYELVTVGNSLALTQPVFCYNGTVMISVEDAVDFLQGELFDIPESSALAVKAAGNVLELIKGSSNAYLNDKLLKMQQPLLSIDGICYLPLDTALHCGGMELLTVDGYHLIYRA